MSTRLVSMKKIDKNNTRVELIVDGEWTQVMIFWKYSKEKIFKALRETCNCTIPKDFQVRY